MMLASLWPVCCIPINQWISYYFPVQNNILKKKKSESLTNWIIFHPILKLSLASVANFCHCRVGIRNWELNMFYHSTHWRGNTHTFIMPTGHVHIPP